MVSRALLARQSFPLLRAAIPAERDRKLVAMTGSEYDSALQRLEAAMDARDRSRARYATAIGTSSELGAYIALRAAGEQVSARAVWLEWVEDEYYGGP
jgi:hypothetical protein